MGTQISQTIDTIASGSLMHYYIKQYYLWYILFISLHTFRGWWQWGLSVGMKVIISTRYSPLLVWCIAKFFCKIDYWYPCLTLESSSHWVVKPLSFPFCLILMTDHRVLGRKQQSGALSLLLKFFCNGILFLWRNHFCYIPIPA